VKSGAHIADVCLQNSDRDELQDIPHFYENLIRKVRAPIMIDTTDANAIELALTYCQGKSIINSINLEDGEEKFERVCPLAKRYGAALVVGCIDEDPVQAQAFTRERNWKSPIAILPAALLRNIKFRRKTSSSIRWCFPAPPAMKITSAAPWKLSKAIRAIKEAMPYVAPCWVFPMFRSVCPRARVKL
jgi:5-methyltetrahydrofolate--homocysteine methyltransferase